MNKTAAMFLTDWRERDGVLVRFNGLRNGWEVKVGGEILKAAFVSEDAAVKFGFARLSVNRPMAAFSTTERGAGK